MKLIITGLVTAVTIWITFFVLLILFGIMAMIPILGAVIVKVPLGNLILFFVSILIAQKIIGDRLQKKYKLRTEHYAGSVAIAFVLSIVMIVLTIAQIS